MSLFSVGALSVRAWDLKACVCLSWGRSWEIAVGQPARPAGRALRAKMYTFYSPNLSCSGTDPSRPPNPFPALAELVLESLQPIEIFQQRDLESPFTQAGDSIHGYDISKEQFDTS